MRPKSLQLALARALSAFPPAAGRLKARSNGAGMDIECNNQGAIFVEAHATATLEDLLKSGNSSARGRDTFQPSPLWKSLAPDPNAIDQGPTEKPLLFTQLTRLAGGGVVLAVKLHHFVSDGAAQDYFVSSWAELARNGEISALPYLDRAVMKARTPPCPSFEHVEYIVHKEVPGGFSSTTKPPPMTSKIFEFRTEDILLLKDRANSHDKKDAFTGFQALASHIWKHVTKARGIEPSCDIKLGWAVDGRKRFNPPLPTNYFGNVNFYGCVKSNAREVVAKPLDCAATSIRSATNRITDEYMRSALDFIESQMNPFLLTASFVGTADLAMTSWTRFASYEVDFGWASQSGLHLPFTTSQDW